MKLFLASDHAGFQLKEEIRGYLVELGYDVHDMGPHRLDPKDDYPDFVIPVAQKVAADPDKNKGIVFGGSGQGEAMVANRFPRVRAAVWYGRNERIITLSREHNDANVLALGARFLHIDDAQRAVKLWLETPFSEDDRHVRRIAKLDKI